MDMFTKSLTVLPLMEYEEKVGGWIQVVEKITSEGGWVLLVPDIFHVDETLLELGFGNIKTVPTMFCYWARDEVCLSAADVGDDFHGIDDIHYAVSKGRAILVLPKKDFDDFRGDCRYDCGRFQ